MAVWAIGVAAATWAGEAVVSRAADRQAASDRIVRRGSRVGGAGRGRALVFIGGGMGRGAQESAILGAVPGQDKGRVADAMPAPPGLDCVDAASICKPVQDLQEVCRDE